LRSKRERFNPKATRIHKPLKEAHTLVFMHWERVKAISVILIDEMTFTLLYFVVLPFFNIYLPLKIYLAVMAVLVGKDVIVVKLIWNIVISQPKIGKESLIGKIGAAYMDFESEGIIQIENELWKAETVEPVKKGDNVKVLTVDGLFLQVEPVRADE
jgi:membrane-bound ClpP family serine protease